MSRTLEFFFDLSSPWTYLAYVNVQPVVARTGAHLVYRPILVGGVFNAVNQGIYAAREDAGNRRMSHTLKVLHDWAALSGVPLKFPSRWHPARSVHAMRMATALEADPPALHRFAGAVFESGFLREENIDDFAVLEQAANTAGLEGASLRAAAATEAVKARLRANTDELIARGGFGSPTWFVGGTDRYFGNDELPLVERALRA